MTSTKTVSTGYPDAHADGDVASLAHALISERQMKGSRSTLTVQAKRLGR